MILISHRGLWNNIIAKNSLPAFEESFHQGIGIETDLRDFQGEIVISHDLPIKRELSFEELLKTYNSYTAEFTLALNIKSDGLQCKIKELLIKYSINNYFVFDMSAPDTLHYINSDLKYFTRVSEIEINPILYDNSTGVWLDMFYSDWINQETVRKYLNDNKKVCIVSPELHKRPFQKFWQEMQGWDLISNDNIIMCTDFPIAARKFFK